MILDGNFIFQAIKANVDIEERITKLLQDSVVKLFIQRSVLDELTAIGDKGLSALTWAQRYCTVLEDKKYTGETPADRLVDLLGK